MTIRTPLIFLVLALALRAAGAEAHKYPKSYYIDTLPREEAGNKLTVVQADPHLRLRMHASHIILSDDGRQPYLFCSRDGTMFCQAQDRAAPFDSKGKQVYHTRIGSAISRDGGRTWTRWTHEKGKDDVNIEGGMLQCADGTILLLDTYVMEGKTPDRGVGELWKSHDDLRTVEGPFAVDFYLPHILWRGSTNDSGVPMSSSVRLHRSLLELPNGDLLTLMYTRFKGDTAPAAYMPSMHKTRSIVIRSRDYGATWAYLATIGFDSATGTEGFGEPVMARIDRGPHAGRLVAVMRTGRNLYQSDSDDNGAHWRRPWPMRLPGVDAFDYAKWERHYGYDPKAPDYVPGDDMLGALVDPELIQMSNGALVCGFGFRAPARRYAKDWHVPEQGDYLAFSLDGGDTWSEVAQYRSGAPCTQYTAVRELKKDVLYVAYDDCIWRMPGHAQGFQLEVRRSD